MNNTSMSQTPISNRLHIGIFGRRNVGKSSFINALTNQNIAIISDVPGTTTDPVYKTIEILPEPGPCVIIDTAGLDDDSELGDLRKKKSIQVLNKTDLAILLLAPDTGIAEFENHLISEISKRRIPIVLVMNKIDMYCDHCDQTNPCKKTEASHWGLSHKAIETKSFFAVSAKTGEGILSLRDQINKLAPSKIEDLSVVEGIVNPGNTVILVIPIDSAMPKGRLILPEVQTLRAILDKDAHAVVCKDYELKNVLNKLQFDPDLVITDSQVYHSVKDMVPDHIRLTSFSMLFARYKGDFKLFVDGSNAIETLNPGDKILIAEACTHHAQPQDIGRFKIPNLLNKQAGGDLHFDYAVASDFPEDLSKYALIIMCGACMVNRKQVQYRIALAKEAGIPVTNYGVIFAKMNGILNRTDWLVNS